MTILQSYVTGSEEREMSTQQPSIVQHTSEATVTHIVVPPVEKMCDPASNPAVIPWTLAALFAVLLTVVLTLNFTYHVWKYYKKRKRAVATAEITELNLKGNVAYASTREVHSNAGSHVYATVHP